MGVRLLLAQQVQILSSNVIHEQITSLERLMFKNAVDTRQSWVMKVLEELPLKEIITLAVA